MLYICRLQSERQWLSNYAGKWSAYNASTGPVAYYSGSLQPVMKASIIPQPMDLTKLSGNGVLYVGYGLRDGPAATVADAFKEMADSQRYYKVWEIGAPLNDLGGGGLSKPGIQCMPGFFMGNKSVGFFCFFYVLYSKHDFAFGFFNPIFF